MKKGIALITAAFLLLGALCLTGCGDHSDDKNLPHDSSLNKPVAPIDNANPGPGNKGGIKPPPP
jgi:hypothetical protein